MEQKLFRSYFGGNYDMALRSLSICAGIGGLDIGVEIAAPEYHTVCYVEREVFAAATLVARMEEQTLHKAPIWDDVATFDGSYWHNKVDIIVAGFPCQPVSHAGKRLGDKDERWIWDDIERVIKEVQPTYLFLENVRGLVSRGLDKVLRSLASMGFDAEWGCLQAGQVGAPQRRERWFCLAYTSGIGNQRRGRPQSLVRTQGEAEEDCEQRERGGSAFDDCGSIVDDTDSKRLQGPQGVQTGGQRTVCSTRQTGSNGNGNMGLFPPGPDDFERWERVPEEIKPAICRMADVDAFRVDRLRALGNGVVPIQAAVAFTLLANRVG